jgi:hypothetical protein
VSGWNDAHKTGEDAPPEMTPEQFDVLMGT